MLRFRVPLCFLFMTLPVPNALATEHVNDHELFCQQSDVATCLQQLQQELARQPEHSAKWYQLQSYLLDYLFDKHQFSKVEQSVAQLLLLPDSPPVFQTQLYFYQAKLMNGQGNTVEARRYANLAQQNLQHMFDAFADPLRLLELANLQAVLGENAQAWNLLLSAESKFYKSKDPVFAFELNTNKALVMQGQNRLAQAAYYRKLALDAILPSGFAGKISVAYLNLGRTEQLLGHFGLAQRYYEQALPYLHDGDDGIRLNNALIRLSEICLQLQHVEQARIYFKQIDAKTIEPKYQDSYQLLLEQFH